MITTRQVKDGLYLAIFIDKEFNLRVYQLKRKNTPSPLWGLTRINVPVEAKTKIEVFDDYCSKREAMGYVMDFETSQGGEQIKFKANYR